MRVYLDACCLNRPFDDPLQDRIRLEADAVGIILRRYSGGELDVVGSEVLIIEVMQTPDITRRDRVLALCRVLSEITEVDEEVLNRARALAGSGIHRFDALHLACAEKAKVDVFLSVDDQLVKKGSVARIPVANPLEWLLSRKEFYGGAHSEHDAP